MPDRRSLAKLLAALAAEAALLFGAFWLGQLSGRGIAPVEAQSAIWTAVIASMVTVAVTILGALISHLSAARRFHSEKWWQKRDVAYEQVIELLGNMQHAIEERVADVLGEKSLSNEMVVLRLEEFKQARESLAKVTAKSAYPLSAKAAAALTDLSRALDGERAANDNWFLTYEDWLSAVTKCRDTVIRAAFADLGSSR